MPEWISHLEQIARDNRTGAAGLTRRAASLLAEAAGEAPGHTSEDFERHMRRVAISLVRAQPHMTPLLRFANGLLMLLDRTVSLEERRWAVPEYCRNFLRLSEEAAATIASSAADLLEQNPVVATHSYSSAVRDALLMAHRSGSRLRVICTESRPICEGVALATELGAAGIPTRLIADAALGWFLRETDVLLVGADSISISGVTNKIGTFPAAVAAEHFDVNTYVLAATDKFRPAFLTVPQESLRPAAELLPETLAGVTPANFYFDITPLPFFNGIVTENDLLTPDLVARQLHSLELHPVLREALA
jgi:translation initiation factor eIF-2B subunit delta